MVELDPNGIVGQVLVWSLRGALLGSSILVFIHFWRQGTLSMGEEPKYQMMEADEKQE